MLVQCMCEILYRAGNWLVVVVPLKIQFYKITCFQWKKSQDFGPTIWLHLCPESSEFIFQYATPPPPPGNWVITGTTKMVPYGLVRSLQLICKSSKIYRYSIVKWMAVIWQGWEGIRKVVWTMTTRGHTLLIKHNIMSIITDQWVIGSNMPILI